MTPRRLLTALSLSAVLGGSLLGFAAPASADDDILCAGGESQRKPGQYQGICVGDFIPPNNGDINKITKDIISIGH